MPRGSTTLPSVLMTIIFGRFFIIWCINLCLFFRIVQAGVNAVEDFSDDDDDDDSSINNSGRNRKTNNDANTEGSNNLQVQTTKVNRSHRRVRRIEIYSDTEDEENVKEKQGDRRYSRRLSRQRPSDGGRRNTLKQLRCVQNLTVIGGYEGDRSNSPSPLPKYKRDGPFFSYSSGYESSDKHSVGHREVCSDCN